MTDRIIDIADAPAYLHVSNDLLKIDRDKQTVASVPLREVAALILAHPRITCTRTVLSGLCEAGGVIVACNRGNQPASMMLPLVGHHVQTERFRAQATASKPTCKRLWKQIIQAKIRAQGNLLDGLHEDDCNLLTMARQVRSGDPANLEAQASRRYWQALFNDTGFRRQRSAPDQNRMLNYGYAVLRAITARAICAAGLHPSLGVHHHNRYNAFCLADDLMEPFRPIVDRAVYDAADQWGKDARLDSTVKQVLIECITERFTLNGESRTLFDILSRAAVSLASVFTGQAEKVELPDL